MAISNYPAGFANGVTVRGLPLLNAYPGQVFWVHSGTGSDGNKGTFDRPFSTIDYAIGRCTASRGDIIMVKAGHTETVSAAGGLALDVIGVAIIGTGTGSLRPTINFTATASTFTISAANCSIYNLLLTGGIDAVVSPVVVSAADVAILNCEYRDVTGQCTDGILTTAGANRLLIDGFRYDGDTAAGTNAGIAIVGGDGIVIKNLRMDGNFAVGGIDIRTTATTDLEVRDVVFRTRNSADIFIVDTITASSGTIGPNLYLRLQDNAANITEAITGATFVQHLPISVVNLAGEIGMAINTTASTDA
jgi:hypothetical protein